ncbi:hypothetical protein [Chengkuizengella axinellae]|uniref:Uncharacterized protein n=1 Tax=Chengkuizengella axinellae TaxID=3064388 RepID=A0ABT9IXI3_9BACL|nr:hypothetical protein [Chengkuizengella sp. 2205SS18-9]MDP5274040.1 hypothetical protein [Chengkuizengella sp. 2205SS18-9]
MQTINLLPYHKKISRSTIILVIFIMIIYFISLPIMVYISITYHNKVERLSNEMHQLELDLEIFLNNHAGEIDENNVNQSTSAFHKLELQSQNSFKLFQTLNELKKKNPSLRMLGLANQDETDYILTFQFLDGNLRMILNELKLIEKYEIIDHLEIKEMTIETMKDQAIETEIKSTLGTARIEVLTQEN